MRTWRRTFAALAVVAALLTTALASGVIILRSGVLFASTEELGIVAAGAPLEDIPMAESSEGVLVARSLQLSQPRDPFRPLITEGSPPGGLPGVGGEPGDAGGGFDPSGTTITLQEIRDVAGTLRATITVNGTSYDVGVGDTFAGSYKVVSLSSTKGVFMFGDSAFELSVGQQILK